MQIGTLLLGGRRRPEGVVTFYDARGTAEQWINEGKNAPKWRRLPCRRLKEDQARLQLFALAYNLANFSRELALPRILFAAILARIGQLRAEPSAG